MDRAGEFLLPFNQPLIAYAKWQELLAFSKKEELGRRLGYGYEVPLSARLTAAYPELEKFRATYNLADRFYFLITHAKARNFPIHIDGELGQNHAASINWPLQNCDQDSTTTWYSVEAPEYECIEGSFFLKSRCVAKELYATTMSSAPERPYLFRSDVWHSGYCGATHKGLRVIVKWMTGFGSWGDACGFFRNQNLL